MKPLILIFLLTGLFRCDEPQATSYPSGCTEEALVKDLTGLDGCSFVLQLKDGTQLIPERRTYVQAPSPAEDPIYYFELKDGEKVMIGYTETQLAGACMAGKIVFITCIVPYQNPIE